MAQSAATSAPVVDVAIVGLGPTGATLANLLGLRGIRVVGIDRDPNVHPKPRAVVLDHEAMRQFQSVGLTERILPHTAIFDRSVYIGLDGRIIKQLITEPPPYALGWCPNYLFSQPTVDQILRDGAREQTSVNLRLGVEVTGFNQDRDAVTLRLQTPDGSTEQLRARYVIAADGGSSPIRRKLGIGFDDLDFDEPWLVVDAIVDEAHLPNLPRTNVQYCEPTRPSTHVIGPGRHRRWELALLPGETPEEMNQEARIWQALSRWISPDNARLWRSSTYRFHALVAKQWVAERIILAGDAAHMTPPFLGQGMCQGLRDTANLAWKLDFILNRGASSEAVLASYMAERAPHVRRTTEVAKELGRIICERDPAKAAARDAELLADPTGVEKVRQSLIPGLEYGLLSRNGSPAVGTIFPQPRLRIGGGQRLMDDLTGVRFRLVAHSLDLSQLIGDRRITRADVALTSLTPGQPDGILTLDEMDGRLASWFETYGTKAALVRPDHYVFGTASTLTEVDALLTELDSALFAR